jgi:hypothetical protein
MRVASARDTWVVVVTKQQVSESPFSARAQVLVI